MITNSKEALLLLVQKQQGKWNEVQSLVKPSLLDWFITMGYIRRSDDKWQITSDGVRQSLYHRELMPKEKEIANLMYGLGL